MTDIFVKGKPITAWFIRGSFERYKRMSLLKRFNEVEMEIFENAFNVNLFNLVSVSFGNRIVITNAYLAKGLEYDQVIVPMRTDKTYVTEPYGQMLNVSRTRVMHRLYITHVGSLCKLKSN